MSSHRDLLERKAFQEAWEREQEAARIEAEKPLREAEAQLQENARRLGALTRQNILDLPDPEVYLSPELSGVQMSMDEAQRFNIEESKKFVESTPEYYPCQENFDAITEYLAVRNKIQIVDSATFKAAFFKLKQYGLLQERPTEPEPEPVEAEPQPDPIQVQAEKKRAYFEDVIATDPRDGQQYTAFQLDELPADEYRRIVFGPHYQPKISDVVLPIAPIGAESE